MVLKNSIKKVPTDLRYINMKSFQKEAFHVVLMRVMINTVD